MEYTITLDGKILCEHISGDEFAADTWKLAKALATKLNKRAQFYEYNISTQQYKCLETNFEEVD